MRTSYSTGLGPSIFCSSLIAGVFFALGVVVSITAFSVTFVEGLGYGAITAVMAFTASLCLSLRDILQRNSAKDRVRGWLLTRADTNDEQYLKTVDSRDHLLAILLRQRLGAFFEVSESKFQIDDSLQQLSFELFLPPIYPYLLPEVFVNRPKGALVSYPIVHLKTIGDLLAEARAQAESRDY